MTLAGLASPGQDKLIREGFDAFFNLEYETALAKFRAAIDQAPGDPERHNHLAQTLLFREMFRAGALESELVSGANPFLRRSKLEPSAEVDKQFHDALSSAIRLANEIRNREPQNIRAIYAMGVAHGLRGNWNFLVRKAYLDALRALTESRKLCNQVVELDPGFIDAKMVQGFHDYVVGSLPGYMRFLGFIAGFRGDKEAGIRTLKEVATRGKINSADAKVLLAVIYRRERSPDDAIPLLEGLTAEYPRNYLFRMELAQMWADKGDGDKALAEIDEVEALRRSGVNGYGSLVPAKIDYARGNIQFWYNRLDQAEQNLRRAAGEAESLDLHTAVMAWLRLGQTYDLLKKRPDAIAAYQAAVRIAPQAEMAKEAKRYLSSPYKRPDKG